MKIFEALNYYMVVFILNFFSNNYLIANSQNDLIDKEKNIISHIQNSIMLAYQGQSKLNSSILNIEGMSSSKVRHLLNNICSAKDSCYLEIGCFKGSTFISALYGNDQSIIDAVGIDNWSEFGGPFQVFTKNCIKFLPNSKYRFFSHESFSLDISSLFPKPVNIYFYDGDHSEEAQELALTYYNKALDNFFILIVDDWNWEKVKIGTFKAFKKLNYEIVYSEELPASFNGDIENWWNGIFIALIRKNNP